MSRSEEGLLFSSKCNPKHCDVEFDIKTLDQNPEKSRSALLERFTAAAESITDWMPTYYLLSNIEHHENAPQFDSWQARYSAETGRKLQTIRQSMEKSLKEGGVITRVLQKQFMLQLLMVNYLESLKKDILTIKSNKMVNEDISLPEMSAIFTEMMLTDRDCDALKEIRRILVDWRNA